MTVVVYWRCRSSSREGSTSSKFHPRVLGVGPDRTKCFAPWRQHTGSGCPRCFSVCHSCFLDVWGLPKVRSVTFYRFQRSGSKPEVVVGGGSRCVRVLLSTCGACLRSDQSVSILGHTKDRTSGPLPPPWKTSGLV